MGRYSTTSAQKSEGERAKKKRKRRKLNKIKHLGGSRYFPDPPSQAGKQMRGLFLGTS